MIASLRPSGVPFAFVSVSLLVALAAASALGADKAAEKTLVKGKAETPMLISANDLQSLAGKPNVAVLDIRPAEEYAAGHIPGAVWIDVPVWKARMFSDAQMHDAEGWAKLVSAAGIGNDTTVVVYGGSLTNAARIWWTLKFLGVEDARLLDGGWAHWNAANLPVAKNEPKPESKPFEVDFQHERLVHASQLLEAIGGKQKLQIVDTRSAEEYTKPGERGGHIPQARHLEWKDLVKEDGAFKSVAELNKLFASRGLDPKSATCTYCQSGGRAAVEAFALELAGYRPVRVYYRSWQEWSGNEKLPTEHKPSAAKP